MAVTEIDEINETNEEDVLLTAYIIDNERNIRQYEPLSVKDFVKRIKEITYDNILYDNEIIVLCDTGGIAYHISDGVLLHPKPEEYKNDVLLWNSVTKSFNPSGKIN